MSDYLAAGQAVRRRREELGLAQGERPPSSATWRKVEQAIDPPFARRTIVALCRALDWTEDSYDRLLAGEHPVTVERPDEGVPWASMLDALTEVRDEVRRLADQLEDRRGLDEPA